jgi:FMN phosphatase YigB (HAD superfamily)
MNYICLDVGNVLVHVDFTIFTRQLSKDLNITIEEAEYFMNRTHALHDMGLTKMADELRDHFKIRSPLVMDELLDTWRKVIYPNGSFINFFAERIASGELTVALLSNVGLEHAGRMKELLNDNGMNLFNNSIKHLSCQVGARKPSKLYYQSFLLQHPEFVGAAYLDDLPENLEAGGEFGLRPFHFALTNHTSEQMGLYQISPSVLDLVDTFIKDGK